MLIQKIKQNIAIVSILLIACLIRFYYIANTPAINPDEAAIGYNAYSLIKTGLDEHGFSFPLHFTSFGDYKPGGYFYLALPFVYIFGLTSLSVRLPNLILSILTILYLFKLVKLLTKSNKFALLSAILLTICPWHIHFSRGAWESNTALSFIVIGIYYFYQAIQTSKIKLTSLLIFTFLFSASIYTYHSTRLIAPLMALFLLIQNHKQLFKSTNIKKLIFICIFGVVISTPVVFSFLSSGGTKRFGGVGLLADQGPIWRANELINQHANVKLINRIIHNKRVLYLLSWMEKFLSHFDLNFLFINGDEVPRSKVPFMGQLHLIELPFLIFGLFQLFKSKNKKFKQLIFTWLLIAPIASSLTFQAPSALRALSMVIPLIIIIAYGISQLVTKITPIAIYLLLITIYSYSFAYYLNSYFILYPKIYPFAWQYEFNQMVPIIEENKNQYDHIFVTNRYDQPYILYLFYSQYNPRKLHPQIKLTPPDQFGFSTVSTIDNITFNIPNWSSIPQNSLIIASDETIPLTPNQVINFPNDSPAFKIYIK